MHHAPLTLSAPLSLCRSLADQIHTLSDQLEQQHATADLNAQLQEFDRHMQQGEQHRQSPALTFLCDACLKPKA